MLKIVSLCAALVLAAAAFSNSAEAKWGGGGGGHVRMGGGGNFGAARVGSFGAVRSMGAPARYGTLGNRGIYRAGIAPGALGNRGIYRAGIAPGALVNRGIYRAGVTSSYGQWQGKGNWSGSKWQGNRHAYWRGGHRHHGGWPWWGAGAGLALAATWPYYGGYGYADYGYDDCVQWRPDWGWVNVCDTHGGYYPY